jgi:hypothetical protein
MIRAGLAHPLCAILSILLAAPPGFAQVAPVASPAVAPPASAAPVAPAAPRAPGSPLSVIVLEGNNVVNSIPLVRSVAAAVEVRDSNDFPVEGATIVFTIPADGPGGTFAQGGKTFSTRSDSRGQAIAPVIIPAGAGKFQIAVTATLGDRKGDAVVNQTNSDAAYVGPPLPGKAWYKRKLVWAVAGVIVAGVIVLIVIKHNSNSNHTVVITPGAPVFQ